MKVALTNEMSDRIIECELTWHKRKPIDVEKARTQHHAYRECLERNGLEVRHLAVNKDYPDSVFVEDTAVVVDELAVITSMGAESRCGEVEALAVELAQYRPLVRIERPARIEGGDVLRVGRKVWVGLGNRTDRAGYKALADILAPHGYDVIAVPVKGALHLKSAITALDDESLIINRRALDPESFAGFKLIDTPPDEPGAANVLRLGKALCLHSGFVRTIEQLDGLSYRLDPVDISELIKAESGVTCSSIIINN